MSSTDTTTEARARRENPIPPWQRIAVNGTTAAQMMGIGRSTFFQRVKEGLYPKPKQDGLWRVEELRAALSAS